jgi:hypothetical protein
MDCRFFLTAASALWWLAAAPAQAVEVRTPQFVVDLEGEGWEHLPLRQGVTPWRYSRDVEEGHRLFTAITWIPLEAEGDASPPSAMDVAEEIIAEARRQAELPGRKLLNWNREEEAALAEGNGCWRYGSEFRLAGSDGQKIEYRSRGFVCHVPTGEGLAWLRYDEFKDEEQDWTEGFEAAAVDLRDSLRAAE